ncbi:BufA1 family periplasmic bufferin-type metallophore [Spongiibacter tropicus]|uniref:BufA1 family periplasmic bufferin-type metallophore n=1 Tax=Spongiibacter tropicus TaxID=454602 RepID=UPI0024E22167|nr:DUF2282 domain-containing protein [Spongiibacter tropicus]|tara:strand:- start:226 stop:513 length:288 start_codon:yes stop_codon:yes gene_type:complete
MKRRVLTTAALAAVIAGSLSAVQPAYAAGKEKCYGIAKAGQNHCANLAGTHSCAAQSTVDYDIGEYMVVDAGSCKSLGGFSEAEARQRFEAEQAQ